MLTAFFINKKRHSICTCCGFFVCLFGKGINKLTFSQVFRLKIWILKILSFHQEISKQKAGR